MRHYYRNTDVIMFLLDSNDRDRISECKDELWRLLSEDELRSSHLLVMANKQDLPNAMSIEEVTEKMGLHNIRNREWCKYNNTIASRVLPNAVWQTQDPIFYRGLLTS